MTQRSSIPNVRCALAMEFDEVDCNTGMSAAHAVAKSVIAQCLRERFPDTAFAVIHQASADLAYDIAFGQRHEQTLPVIAAQAAGAAFNLVQADLDQLGWFMAQQRSDGGCFMTQQQNESRSPMRSHLPA